jgi:chemotaxis protein MotB
MMTLLFGFFVILYSFSQVDEKKFSVVGKQLAEAFGGEANQGKSNSEVGSIMESRDLRALQLLVAMLNLGDSIPEAEKNLEKNLSAAKNLEGARDYIMSKAKHDGELEKMGIHTLSKEEQIEIALPDSLLFQSGTAVLVPRAVVALARIAGFLTKVNGLVGIEIVGHTDSAPPAPNAKFANNWALSSARAGAVAEELIRQGVSRKGLITRGMADLEPLFPERRSNGTWDAENMAKNRRVHIIVKKLAPAKKS